MSTQQFNIGPGLTPAEVNDIKTHVDGIMAVLAPHLVNLTAEERKKQRNIGRRIGYVKEMLDLVNNQPDIFPASFDATQFKTVMEYLNNLGDMGTHQTNYVEGLSDTQLYYGHIAMLISDRVYAIGKEEENRGNTAVGEYIERASRYFAGQGQKGHNTEIEIAAGATMNVEHLSAGSPFDNIGAANLSVQKTGAAAPVLIVNAGEHVQLPDDFTSITVIDLDGAVGGKFRIKLRAQ